MSLRPHTFATFFGLLACTGLRVSEALSLTRPDVDWRQGLLTIRQTKFRKSRLVPLHPSAADMLKGYARLRDRFFPASVAKAFFVTFRARRCGSRRWKGFSGTCEGSSPGRRVAAGGHGFTTCGTPSLAAG